MVVVIGATLAMAAPAHAQLVLPPGFESEKVADVAIPTAVAFTPDGRTLVTEQIGRLRVITPTGQLLPPALDISSRICTDSERGLLGVAVDPNFSLNGHIYLYYTHKRSICGGSTNALNWPQNRISRFTLGVDNRVLSGSEVILITGIPSKLGIHNGGDLEIGKDGYLYGTVGDGGCDYNGSGCADQNDAARNLNVLLGKIVRITRTGGIPASNPYAGASNGRRCNTGVISGAYVCQEIFATGLRNPFRFAFDPDAVGTEFFINDVGSNTWEEVDRGARGADYGWNLREGPCVVGSATNCGATGFTNPIFSYRHDSEQCASITGGAFTPNGVWPEYDDAYLFADFTCGKIFALRPGTGGTFTREVFATGAGTPTNIDFGPAPGGGQALYYTTFAGGGALHRITLTGSTNRKPLAALTSDRVAGALPLTVAFDGSGSSDPDGDALTYIFDPGDGSGPVERSEPVFEHTYTVEGGYTASLVVRDPEGLESTPATLVVQAGRFQPTVGITGWDASAQRFRVGQQITLGVQIDDADAAPGEHSVRWRALKHHNDHTHPFLSETEAPSVTLTMPPPEDLAAVTTSYVELLVQVVDADGLTATATIDLRPNIVWVSFDSWKNRGAVFQINGSSRTTLFALPSWAGWALNVVAPAKMGFDSFKHWTDGVTSPSRVFVTPDSAYTLTAFYSFL